MAIFCDEEHIGRICEHCCLFKNVKIRLNNKKFVYCVVRIRCSLFVTIQYDQSYFKYTDILLNRNNTF